MVVNKKYFLQTLKNINKIVKKWKRPVIVGKYINVEKKKIIVYKIVLEKK